MSLTLRCWKNTHYIGSTLNHKPRDTCFQTELQELPGSNYCFSGSSIIHHSTFTYSPAIHLDAKRFFPNYYREIRNSVTKRKSLPSSYLIFPGTGFLVSIEHPRGQLNCLINRSHSFGAVLSFLSNRCLNPPWPSLLINRGLY